MDSHQVFVIIIFSIISGAWIAKSWIRGRHERAGGDQADLSPSTERKIELLSGENGRLKDQIVRLEERVAVLERIVTDTSTQLSHEIDSLR